MTTVRPLQRTVPTTQLRALPKAPSFVRLSLGVLGRVAPELAIEQLYRAYFTPSRYRSSSEERAVLAEAAQSRVCVAGHTVVRYQWDRPEFPWERQPERTAVLLHGWSGAAAQMTPLVPALQRAGFAVVAYDAPAHGRAPGAQTNLAEMAHIAATVAGAHDVVVAHSLGATAALIALQTGWRAHRLALMATGAIVDAYPLRFAEAAGAPAELGVALRGRLLSEFGEHVLRPAQHDALRFVPTPVLLVHDLDDSEAPYAGAQLLAQRLPKSQLVTTAGLGHRRLLKDAPVIDEVVRFLV